MKSEKVDLFAKRMTSNPIAKSPKLTAGDYAVQKTNDDYNIIAEVNGTWKPVDESKINTIPTDARWIMFNNVLNHKTGKPVTASVNLEFKGIALKTNLLMSVNEKGYTNIDVRPLSTKELKAFKSEVIEEPVLAE